MSAVATLDDLTSTSHSSRIVIIGGGITGLSTAFYLERMAKTQGVAVTCTLIERSDRLGGKILTEKIDQHGGFLIEGGPDSFVAQKPWGVELVHDLGLSDQLMMPNREQQKVYVLLKGKLCAMPDGLQLIVPTKILPFALSPMISPLGKLRMAMDLFIPPKRDGADETLAEFMRRRLGNEALDRIGEPLLSGIHSSAAERQSLLATFPRFRTMEEKYGSLTRGMLAMRRQRKQSQGKPQAATSPFVSLRGGIEELVQALKTQVQCDVLTGCGVTALVHTPDNAEAAYHITLDNRETLQADAVVVTTPSYITADLVEKFQPALAEGLRRIRYVSTATVSLAYRHSDVGEPLKGFGLVIPRTERRRINACTMTSRKFAHRAPDDHALVRVFVGGSRTPEMMQRDDAEMLNIVREELRSMLKIDADPIFSRIYRWPDAQPQYDVGHLDHMTQLAALCPAGFYLSGSAYHGVGIPDCVKQGKDAAAQAIAHIQERFPVSI
ncbi:MAG: Protoporphyrinogen oxidase [Chloroflexi bacterium AL-W]|nr:Protoporphyrinogen oxidase [Chloroflexi bacterium AL-N1]NOK69209.1 Protoporphyrinogen oxidase [Chloroflexi bacterium AL-N10]NOK77192.1 Protoporphyrinogen oxidase [Chloroflexi bacterium AL-N5]NOK83837.1 Protoporphyrinogen oxidase [Chloroflexi bacterium AL-W]NOK91047.1 Protoporphyrinogen oxidase [Chloroflexi bacterium AL-N15]